MDSFTLYRERIGESLTKRLADAIAQQVVTFDEAAEISNTILEKIDLTRNSTELMAFVEDLAHKWPLFGPILVAEQAQEIEAHEEEALHQVSDLLKENKIEEATATAGQATQDTQDTIPSTENFSPDGDTIPNQEPQNEASPTQDSYPSMPETDMTQNTPPIDTPIIQELETPPVVDQPTEPIDTPDSTLPPPIDSPDHPLFQASTESTLPLPEEQIQIQSPTEDAQIPQPEIISQPTDQPDLNPILPENNQDQSQTNGGIT